MAVRSGEKVRLQLIKLGYKRASGQFAQTFQSAPRECHNPHAETELHSVRKFKRVGPLCSAMHVALITTLYTHENSENTEDSRESALRQLHNRARL